MSVFDILADGTIVQKDGEGTTSYDSKTKTLWTNPNPTSNFAAQSITLTNENLDAYSTLQIVYYNNNAGNRYITTEIKPDGNAYEMNSVHSSGSTVYVYYRSVSASGNTLNFGTCWRGSNSGESSQDNANIPVRIIGIKRTPNMLYMGEALFEGNGIKIDNGVISNDDVVCVYTVPSNTTQVNITGLDLKGDGNVYEIYFYSPSQIEDWLYLRFNNRNNGRYYDRYNTFQDNPLSAYLASQSAFVAGAYPRIAKITLEQFGDNVSLYANGAGLVNGQYATFLTVGYSSDTSNITSIQLFSGTNKILADTKIIVRKAKYNSKGTVTRT